MLQLSTFVLNKTVFSIRTGGVIATVNSVIINPNNLKIEGFYCLDRLSRSELILLAQDIRDMNAANYLVNDHDVLVEAHELVRLKEVLSINFELIGKQVVTVSQIKVGKVNDYAVDISSMYIQKLYVSQSLLKSFTGGNLSIDRSQINEITPKQIIINELTKGSRVPSPVTAPVA
jgi:sporulation protein YlmC with PRC-barrel domain